MSTEWGFNGLAELARKSAAEGMVLLKNTEGALPIKGHRKVAVFGRCQIDTFYVGHGSGGDVHPPYLVSVLEGLKACGQLELNRTVMEAYVEWCAKEENRASLGTEWGKWPYSYPEMPLDKGFVEAAARESDTAVVVIGRAAGEDRENCPTKGSYYLTDAEEAMLSAVTEAFKRTVVVMNCGNVIDFSWTQRYEVQAILMMWLAGMESGNALADILTGKLSPSGKLTSAIAKRYEDYPSATTFGGAEYSCYEEDIYVGYRYFETFAKDRILYPFGYGLSYTDFEVEALEFKDRDREGDGVCEFILLVRNVGNMPGKEVVQIYLEAPQGKLGKESRRLIAFEKTPEILPGKEQEIKIVIPVERFASYDDTGKTGHPSCWVLETGEYWFYHGVSLPNGRLVYRNAGGYDRKTLGVCSKLTPICPLREPMERITPVKTGDSAIAQMELLMPPEVDMRKRILESLPEEIPYTGDRGIRFEDVVNNKVAMADFVAQLTDEELQSLTRGEGGMGRPWGVEGNAGVYGGFLPSLQEKGVAVMTTTDGPTGLRIKEHTSLVPCATALACTFNPDLIEELYTKMAEEATHFGVNVLLAPGMNIHRNPLGGRNFEYFSEDPYLTGKMAAATVRGIQSKGASACPKHFAGNNQETERKTNDSRISERALREIYLSGFQICVAESKPKHIMTSYNKINGVWSHYNYDLATTVLRKEWGYEGTVITDWWMQKDVSPEFPKLRDNAYRVRAGVDVLMPGNEGWEEEYPKHYVPDETLLETLGEPDGITRAELQRTAMTVLNFIKTQKK